MAHGHQNQTLVLQVNSSWFFCGELVKGSTKLYTPHKQVVRALSQKVRARTTPSSLCVS